MCMHLCMCAFGQLYKRLAVAHASTILWLDDNEEDSHASTESSIITAENDPYDDQVSAEEWNFLFNDSNDDDDAFHGC